MMFGLITSIMKSPRQDRIDTYLKIKSHYTESEFLLFDRLSGILIEAYYENQNQDFLGEIYMELGISNKRTGENFTPFDAAALIARVTMGNVKKQLESHYQKTGKYYMSVADFACSSGVLLIAAAKLCRKAGLTSSNMLFVAQDISYKNAMACYLLLSWLSCAGYVVVGNSLTEPMTGHMLIPPKDAFCTPMCIVLTGTADVPWQSLPK